MKGIKGLKGFTKEKKKKKKREVIQGEPKRYFIKK